MILKLQIVHYLISTLRRMGQDLFRGDLGKGGFVQGVRNLSTVSIDMPEINFLLATGSERKFIFAHKVCTHDLHV